MTDAFKCDICALLGNEPFHEGRPAEKLYQKVDSQKDGVSYKATIDLCKEHRDELDLTDYTF